MNQLKDQIYGAKQLIKPKIEQANVSIVYQGQSAALSQPASQLVQLQYAGHPNHQIVVPQNVRVTSGQAQKGKHRIAQPRVFFLISSILHVEFQILNFENLTAVECNPTGQRSAKHSRPATHPHQHFWRRPKRQNRNGSKQFHKSNVRYYARQ